MSAINWNLGDQEAAKTGSFSIGGGAPVPAGVYKALIDEAKIDQPQWEPAELVSLRWTIIDGEHKNRKIFQKLKINDPEKQQKAVTMLMAIDTNCGGNLQRSGQLSDDLLMQSLVDKIMLIQVEVWILDGKEGNWISAVSRNGVQQQQAPAPTLQPAQSNTYDADVPF